MKQFIAMILAVVMVFALAACGSNESDIRGDITPGGDDKTTTGTTATNPTNATEATTPSTEATNAFEIGQSTSGKYVNKFAGISCELGADWVYMTDEQIRQNNELTLGLVGQEYAEALQNVSMFTDMMATHTNGTDTVNVAFEKLSSTLSEEEYVNLGKDTMKSTLEAAGMTNVVLTSGKGTFAGQTHAYVEISAVYYDVPLYEKMVMLKLDNYMVLVTACTWQTNGCDAILNMFKAA